MGVDARVIQSGNGNKVIFVCGKMPLMRMGPLYEEVRVSARSGWRMVKGKGMDC